VNGAPECRFGSRTVILQILWFVVHDAYPYRERDRLPKGIGRWFSQR
jgi:hypothetical protein